MENKKKIIDAVVEYAKTSDWMSKRNVFDILVDLGIEPHEIEICGYGEMFEYFLM